MKTLIVPNIVDTFERERVIDELPQAADGDAVMTTSPKFVPNKAVAVKSGDSSMRVRLVDCVGFMIDGATGERNVKTPWSETEMPFDKAAEVGTKKVIKDHSTIAIAVTTDGSIGGFPRENYLKAEEETIKQLKKHGKPYIVVVNSKNPMGTDAKKTVNEIIKKYGGKAMAADVEKMDTEDIHKVFDGVLSEFPISGFKVSMPKWLQVLPAEHEVILNAVNTLRDYTKTVIRIADNNTANVFNDNPYFLSLETADIDVGTGTISYNLVPKDDLYYKVISKDCGVELSNEQQLMAYISRIAGRSREYDKLKDALVMAEETGYGVVVPTLDSYKLDTPKLHKSGKTYGLKLRATAPSLHIIKVDVGAEVTPTIGTQEQSKEMLEFLKNEYENNKDAVWQTPIFGKSLDEIMQEGVGSKISNMPVEATRKVKRIVGKIVNNGKGGIVCILL
jgi:stage IV sporulation protein A